MHVVELDYKIDAFDILLDEDCLLARYYPLIPYKSQLITRLKEMGYQKKSDCGELSNDELLKCGLQDERIKTLFKTFIKLYDTTKQKYLEIEKSSLTEQEKKALYELYKLPGVRLTRAKLYYQAGYINLQTIAIAQPKQIIDTTKDVILKNGLLCKAPFMKEVKTHIAVAKALTDYAV